MRLVLLIMFCVIVCFVYWRIFGEARYFLRFSSVRRLQFDVFSRCVMFCCAFFWVRTGNLPGFWRFIVLMSPMSWWGCPFFSLFSLFRYLLLYSICLFLSCKNRWSVFCEIISSPDVFLLFLCLLVLLFLVTFSSCYVY